MTLGDSWAALLIQRGHVAGRKSGTGSDFLRSFSIHCVGKLIINERPDVSIGPQGIVNSSVTPCLIPSVVTSVTAPGRNFP